MSLPVVEYLKLPEGGEPYLEGHKCSECGSIFLGCLLYTSPSPRDTLLSRMPSSA